MIAWMSLTHTQIVKISIPIASAVGNYPFIYIHTTKTP